MATFSHTYGPAAMLAAVAEHVKDAEMPDSGSIDVHTITLVLNGQHGEFDLTIEATDQDMEDRTWTGIAHRSGGVDNFREVPPR
jgi:hypothetical protein